MGLDTTHDCFHGAYSAFSRWRHEIAIAAGYCVWEVISDAWPRSTPMIMLEWHRYRAEVEILGQWSETPHDPLIVLFAHSDCEGVIHPAQGVPLAERLEAIAPKLEGISSGGHIAARGGYAEVTRLFAAGLRAAAAAGEDVEFH